MMQGRRLSDKLVIFGSVVALIVVIVLSIFLINLASNLVEALLPLVAGTLLMLANRGAVIQLIRTRQASPAMTSAVIGLALVLFGLGKTVGGESWLRVLFYLPGFILMLMALPLSSCDRPVSSINRILMSLTSPSTTVTVKRPSCLEFTPTTRARL